MNKKRPWGEFKNVYKDTVADEYHFDPEKLQQANDELLQKHFPKNIDWYPIFSDRINTYQGDLMFEPYTNSKGEKILQAILCVVNVNTKYAFARTVDYYKNVKAMDERNWNDTSPRVLLNNKDASLVLRSFKRILADMKGEDEALDEFQDLKDHSCFKIERLYEDDGSEFKGVLAQFCNDNNIRLVAYKPNEGSKWRLGVIERFNRTLRLFIEKQLKMRGKMTLDKFIPRALDLYNRYLNHCSLAAFFRRDLKKGESWNVHDEGKMHFFPAMMLVPGVEEEYIKYMHQRTQNVESHYADKIKHLAPGTQVRYYKRDINPFQKSRGNTMSTLVSIVGRHTYKHHGNTKQGASYVLDGTVQRYLPYELEFVNKKNKISKPKNKTVLI